MAGLTVKGASKRCITYLEEYDAGPHLSIDVEFSDEFGQLDRENVSAYHDWWHSSQWALWSQDSE